MSIILKFLEALTAFGYLLLSYFTLYIKNSIMGLQNTNGIALYFLDNEIECNASYRFQ